MTSSPVNITGPDVLDRQTHSPEAMPGGDTGGQLLDEETRRTNLLKTYALLGILISAIMVMLVRQGVRRGLFASTQQGWWMTFFPLVFVALSGTVLLVVQRQQSGVSRSQQTLYLARFYVWATFLTIVLVAAFFNGYFSSIWLLVAWPIVLAGGLLQPISSLWFALGAFGVFVVTLVLETLGLYAPPMPGEAESFSFFTIAFSWLMSVQVVALVNYLNTRSLNRAMTAFRTTSSDLELAQRDLEQRVEDRTEMIEARAEQLRTIAELGQIATSIQDTATLLSQATTLISERLGFYHVGIFLIDPSGEWAVLRGVSSEGGARMLARDHRLRVGQEGIVGYVAAMGVSRFAFNVGEDAVWFNNPDLPETRSEIALPLIVAERIIGVLDIQTQESAAFTEEDVGTFRVLADSMAVAIQNARLLQETREALARVERYQEDDAIRAWRQALSRRRMQFGYTYSGGGVETLAVDTAAAVNDTATTNLSAVPLASRLHAYLGQVEGVTRRTDEDGRHLLLAPIHVSGMQLGVLSFEAGSEWSDEAVQLVETVVGQLDLALTNARLIEETRLRATQEAARGEIVGRIRAMTSTDAILRNAAEELGRALQVERSRIQLVRFGDEE